MNIAFVDTVGSPYDGSTPNSRGLGGSESSLIYISRELSRIGLDVTVYNDCSSLDCSPGTYDGVTYKTLDSLSDNISYDVVVVSRSTRPFTSIRIVQDAKFRVLWMHDTFCDGDEDLERLVVNGLISEVWTLSDWHTTYVSQCIHGHRRMMEVLKRKIWVTRNGVNLYRQCDMSLKSKNNFIFNAAVSKGMVTLLQDVWPRVRERIPEANLTIIGGAYPLKNADVQNDLLSQLRSDHDGRNGVRFTGIISQSDVSEYLVRSGFMIYPQSFPETFGISTVESLAYGTPVISGRFGAMEETAIDSACYLMDYPVDSNVLYTFDRDRHIEQFVDLVVNSYNNDYLWQQKRNLALSVREVCEWSRVALQWKQHLYRKTGRYLSVNEYREVQRINHRTHEIFNKRWSNIEEWAYYPESEKHLEVIIPFYNSSQYLRKCIESIAAQNYERFRVHLIDDCSSDDSQRVIEESISEFNIRDKVLRYINDDNVGALANQIGIISHLDKDSIVVLIDGDDALSNDPNIFKKINSEYHQGAEMTYGSMWSMADNIPLVAQEYPNEVFEEKSFRSHRFNWNIPYTHLRTFSVSLFNHVNLNDLRDDNGVYYKAGGDSALFYALIEQCKDRFSVRPIRDILYLYNDINPINDYKINSEEQTKNSLNILSKKNQTPIKKKNQRILIAIPTAQNIHAHTFKSIYDLDIPEGFEVDFQFFYGYCVDQVRNLIANFTIENNYDYLFSVDYDIEFDRDTLKKLLSHDKHIVSGLYIQRKPGQHILEIYRDNGFGGQSNVDIKDLQKKLEPIDGCGFGCVLVKSEVLRGIGYPQFTYHHAIKIEDTISEDVDFCRKAKSKGFKMFADTTILCRHHGNIAFGVMNGK
jgi:glycosyltransferase involved in cell wall biosynthesis